MEAPPVDRVTDRSSAKTSRRHALLGALSGLIRFQVGFALAQPDDARLVR